MRIAICGKRQVGKTTLLEEFVKLDFTEVSFTEAVEEEYDTNEHLVVECPPEITQKEFDLLQGQGFFMVHITTGDILGSVVEGVAYPTDPEDHDRYWDVWLHNVGSLEWLRQSASSIYKSYLEYEDER